MASILILTLCALHFRNGDPHGMFSKYSNLVILLLSFQLLILSRYANTTKSPFLVILVFWNIAFILLRIVTIPYCELSLYFLRIISPNPDVIIKSIECLILMNIAVLFGEFAGKKLERIANKRK